MNGEQVRRLRDHKGWTRRQLSEMLNAALDRKYNSETIGGWERGDRNVPKNVEVFLTELEVEQLSEALPDFDAPPPEAPGRSSDSFPPGEGGEVRAQLPLPGGGAYARVCTELWELVATGVGMVGVALDSENLRRDGQIIDADKEALGRAYGKLAEQNDTFRRMLVGMTTGGAWLEVALVTGVTAGKIMRQHQEPIDGTARRVRPVPEPPDGGEDVVGFAAAPAA